MFQLFNFYRVFEGLYMKFFLALLLLCATSAFAEIYKWTDENGNVHFGDNPNNKEKATELKIDTESRTGVTHSSGRNKDRDRLLKNRAEERVEKAKKKKKYEAKKKRMRRKCLLAKDGLDQHLRASAIYKVDSKGERKYYSTKQRAKSLKRLQKSISKYCSY